MFDDEQAGDISSREEMSSSLINSMLACDQAEDVFS